MIQSIRINYHSDRKLPIVAELVSLMKNNYGTDPSRIIWVERHWLRGPHLKLLISSENPDRYGEIARLEGRVLEILESLPSMTPVDRMRWVQLSERLGRLELIPGPYEPIEVDNTIYREKIIVQDTFLRDETTYSARGRLISDALTAVDIAVFDEPSSRAEAVLSAMAALANSYGEGGIVRGYLAFLSHWKEFFLWHDPSGDMEARLAESYREQSEHLVKIVNRAVGRLADSFWDEWIAKSSDIAINLALEGRVIPYPQEDRHRVAQAMSPALGRRWGGDDDRPYSDFHRAFRALDFTKLGDGVTFSAYRFQINALFEIFSILDVSPAERYAIAYFFTRAVEDIEGVNWQEMIEIRRKKQAKDPTASPTLPWRR